MAIFLLVSVGSVCASEDANADVALAEDGQSIVLANGTTDTPQEKITTEIVAEDTTVRDTDKTFNVAVNDNGSKPIVNVTKNDLKVMEGNSSLAFSYNNSQITISDKLALGNHSLIINYLGNEIYKNSTKNIVLSIFGNYTIKSADSIDVNSTKIVEIPLNITNGLENITITGKFTGSLSYKEGNNTTTVDVSGLKYENGKVIFDYKLLDDITSSTLVLTYTENDEKASKNITINRIFNAKIEVIRSANQYQNGNFTFRLTDIDTNQPLSGKKLSLTTIGNIRAGFSAYTNDQGIATFRTAQLYEFDNTNNSFTMKQLEVGTHSVELSTDGAIKSTKVTTNLTIKKAKINIKIKKFEEPYGTKKNVTITVTNAKNGEPVPSIVLHLSMPQTSGKDYYFMTDSNGQSKIAVNQLVGGTYNIAVSNNDTKNIKKKTVKGKIVIKPIKVKIKASNNKVYYNTGATTAIKVTYKNGTAVAGAIVYVQFDKDKKKTYLFQANNKGKVRFSASLATGTHKMVVKSGDTRYSAKAISKTIKVKKASAKISAPKVKAYYKSEYFTISVNNAKNNKPIYDAKVNIKIFISSDRYYNYQGSTGAEGKLKLLTNLNPGKYKVVVENGDGKNYTAKSVTTKIILKKTPAVITPTKVTAKKGSKNTFNVNVTNTKTKNPVQGVKVKIKVYTGKTAKSYKVTTDANGVAKLDLSSLSVGTHKVVVKSAEKYCVAKKAKSEIVITK